jgi:hypothetical protein
MDTTSFRCRVPAAWTATASFTAWARNLQDVGERAGLELIIVVSIIGIDRFTAGFLAAKLVHERAMLSGRIPVRILRAAQFHEFVPVLDIAKLLVARRGDAVRI